MDSHNNDKDVSEDEIFFGKLSLKEIKKHVMMNRSHSLSCTKTEMEDTNSSIKIIETCSEPELQSGISLDDSHSSWSSEHKASNNWASNSDNQSFLEMEKIVSELVLLDNKEKEELDNTLDVVEYILNNAPSSEECHIIKTDITNSRSNNYDQMKSDNTGTESSDTSISQPETEMSKIDNLKYFSNTEDTTPITKSDIFRNHCKSTANILSSSKTIDSSKNNNFQSSPGNNMKQSLPTFKTPKAAVSTKKHLQTPKTITKFNSYQHITSPVATYIRNGPQVPLFKDVKPQKPLSTTSSIPKLLKSSEKAKSIALPPVAYKNAKSMKVIKMPVEERLPQSPWAKKLTSSLPIPIVIKHDHRENTSSIKMPETQPEDSFANLPLHQADVSVCTQKNACNKVK